MKIAPRGIFAVALLGALLPCAALAQLTAPPPDVPAYAFDMPEGWAFRLRVGTRQVMIALHDADGQMIQVRVEPNETDPDAFVARFLALTRATGMEVTDEGSALACDGKPAHRFSVRGSVDGVPMESHGFVAVINGGLGTVLYVHQQSVAPRRDAMNALTTLCSAPFAMPSIEGWTRVPTSPVGIVILKSPDGVSSFYGAYRRLARERFPGIYYLDPGATVLKTTDIACANGLLRRVDLRKGPTSLEVVEGYLDSGYSYVFTYERPESRAADAGAERALTMFCEEPTLASAGSS